VYCASFLSLATLEYFVHVDSDELPDDLVSIRASLADDVAVEHVDPSRLPPDWRQSPGPDELRDIGSAWLDSMRTIALLVPSAVTPSETNIVITPRHPDMSKLIQLATAGRAGLWQPWPGPPELGATE